MRQFLMRTAVRTAMSSDAFVKLAGRGRSKGKDEELDRQIAAALEYQRIARLPPLESMEPAAARAYAHDELALLDLDPEPMARVIDASAGGVPVRIFVPHDAGPDWLVYYHGGGGVIGSIASSEPVTRYLAAKLGCTVASVGYRLGPEHKHPAAVDDACAAYRALLPRVAEGANIGVAGDSFGGYLSVQVDRFTFDQRLKRPAVAGLIYPILDFTLTSPSIERYADGYLLTRSMMHWFRGHYLHDTDDQKAVSPWFWSELRHLSPTVLATAGYDPLVDEGDAWALRLVEAGVQVRHHRYGSLVHGFLSMAGAVRAARAAFDELCADLAMLLRS